jgi:hypothetical protein
MPAADPRTITGNGAPALGTELRFVQISATRSALEGHDLVYGLTCDGRVYEMTAGGWKALAMKEMPR